MIQTDCFSLMNHAVNLKELKKLEGTVIEFPLSPTNLLEICYVGESTSNCKWGNWKGAWDNKPKYSRLRGPVPNWLICSSLIK